MDSLHHRSVSTNLPMQQKEGQERRGSEVRHESKLHQTKGEVSNRDTQIKHTCVLLRKMSMLLMAFNSRDHPQTGASTVVPPPVALFRKDTDGAITRRKSEPWVMGDTRNSPALRLDDKKENQLGYIDAREE